MAMTGSDRSLRIFQVEPCNDFPGNQGGIARGMDTDNKNHFYPTLDPLTDLA